MYPQGVPRYPCAWCDRSDTWPDLCSETPGASDPRCAETIAEKCTGNDHRRCGITACAVAARWHEPVRRAGVEAARTAGVAWAVVSTIDDHDVSVVGTDNDLARARTVVRDGFLRRAGIRPGSYRAGPLYVVRRSDGAFF